VNRNQSTSSLGWPRTGLSRLAEEDRIVKRIALFVCMLSLAGCVESRRAAQNDPAIIGGTFTGTVVADGRAWNSDPDPGDFIGRDLLLIGDRTVEVMAGDKRARRSAPHPPRWRRTTQSGQLSMQGAKRSEHDDQSRGN
jgi:hypothetical protein